MAESLSQHDHDPTVYPVTDDMGTSSFEMLLRLLLLPLVRRWLAHQGRPCFVGADQFIYWERFNPSKCVAPDLYLCPALPPEACPDALKLWMMDDHAVPPFALEVVSENKGKDYVVAPRKYEELGAQELVVYDPQFEHREGGWRWQVYRQKKRGGWKKPEVSNEDRVWSETLGCWLRVVVEGGEPLLRLGVGAMGDELFPTQEEMLAAAKEDAEQQARLAEVRAQAAEQQARIEQQARQIAERQAETERQAKLAAEQQVRQALERERQQACEAVVDLCELLAIDLDPLRLATLAQASTEELLALRAALKASRRWPSGS
jgi:Uma2 family endonuclease